MCIRDREYWAQKKGQAALDKQNAPMIAGGITPVSYTHLEFDEKVLDFLSLARQPKAS